jgi:hypothetical protein
MNKQINIIALLLVLLLPQISFCADGWMIFRKLGSTRNETLTTCSPETTDISGFIYNPAAPGSTASDGLMLLSENGAFDDKYGALLFSKSLASKTRVALCAAYYDAGSEDLFWVDNGALQTQNVNVETDMLGILSVENDITSKLSLGLSLKFATSRLAELASAQAYAGDAGLTYKPWHNGLLSLGVQNIGDSTAFVNVKDPLPQAATMGVGQIIKRGAFYSIIGVSAKSYYDEPGAPVAPEAGIEFGTGNISLNAGCRYNDAENTQLLAVQYGINVTYKHISFGYAYIPGTNIDAAQRISLTYMFSKPPKEISRVNHQLLD